METATIAWNLPKLARFKKAYHSATGETFVFEGHEFVVEYARFLIEYLSTAFKGGS